MKGLKLSACALSATLLLSGCSMSNTAKGGLIGAGGGGAIGALIGSLAGGGKGAAIGSAVGAAVGTGAGVLIGNKMDKAKKAAEQANAQAELLTDSEGTPYVKATFSSGLLFKTGQATLSPAAASDLAKFVSNLRAEDTTFALTINGYTDNQGWKNSTAEQSRAKNQQLSLQRAEAVKNQLLASGFNAAKILSVQGYGEDSPVASNATAAGQEQNRRVEVYILPSKEMIDAANRQAGR